MQNYEVLFKLPKKTPYKSEKKEQIMIITNIIGIFLTHIAEKSFGCLRGNYGLCPSVRSAVLVFLTLQMRLLLIFYITLQRL